MKTNYYSVKKFLSNKLKTIENKMATSSHVLPLVKPLSAGRTPISHVTKRIEVSAGETLVVNVESVSDSAERGAALFSVKVYDKDGQPLRLENWDSNSAKVGQYFYLEPSLGQKPVQTQVVIPVPDFATVVELVGVNWKQGTLTFIVGEVVSNVAGAESMVSSMDSGVLVTYPSSSLRVDRELPEKARRVQVVFTHKAGQEKSSAPVRLSFRDAEGNPLPPITELAQNPNIGPFLPLTGEPGVETQTSQVLEIPTKAASLHLEGVDWGKKTPELTAPVELIFPEEDSLSIAEFIDSVPLDEPLIIIDTTAPPLGHKTLSLRPNNLTMAYERLGAWVIFIPFGSVQDQVNHHSDRVFQINRDDFDLMLQLCVEKRHAENSYFICSSFPSFQSVTAVNYLKTRGWNTLYECRDDMEEFNRVGYSKWYSTSLERSMVLAVDQVISVSTALDLKLKALAPAVKNHSVIPNAVNQHVIDNGVYLRTSAALENRQFSNVVGYVGHLTDSWFDWPAMEEVARRLPHLEFEIIGHGAPENLTLPTNIKLLGAKSHDELPEIVAHWKVALIPFKDMPLTRSVDPNKIYEYFAWGLRCVTAPMGMVEKYPSTWVYNNVDEFAQMLHEATESNFSEEELDTLNEFVKTASWDHRARQMFEKMEISTELTLGVNHA